MPYNPCALDVIITRVCRTVVAPVWELLKPGSDEGGPFSGRVGALSRDFWESTWGSLASCWFLGGNRWICRCQTFNVFPIFLAFEGGTFFYIGPNLVGSDMLVKTG